MAQGRPDQQAVLFDLDGVLVQTEPLKALAHATVIRRLGGHADPSWYVRHLGQSHDKVRAAFLARSAVHADPGVYSRLYRDTYASLLRSQLAPAPGARELVERLRGQGYLLGLITSSDSETAQHVLRKTGFMPYLDVRVCADEVTHPKPAPDAYRLALRRLNLRDGPAVAIEDSESGIEAAAGAGLPVIAVRHRWNADHDFTRAIAEFSSLRDSARILSTIESILMPVRA